MYRRASHMSNALASKPSLAVRAGKSAWPEAANKTTSTVTASRAFWKIVLATMLCTASLLGLPEPSVGW